MIEILELKALGANRFDVLYSENGAIKKQIVRYGIHRIDTSDNLVMSYLIPDGQNANEFFEMMVQDKSFHHALMMRVKAEVEKETQQIAA
jgi:hypothetical protein